MIKNDDLIKLLIHISQRKIILPFYHTVSNYGLPHIGNLYSVRNVKTFQNDLEYFCKYFEPVSIEQLHDTIDQGRFIRKPLFHLSFDDGLKEFYSIIAPVLEQKGIPATVFVNNKFIDNKELFYRYKINLILNKLKIEKNQTLINEVTKKLQTESKHNNDLTKVLWSLTYNNITIINEIAQLAGVDFNLYLQNKKPYLTTNEINDLIKRGFSIGSHSMDHPFFKHINSKQQQDQILESFTDLERKFNITKRYFSFPFSDEKVDAEFFRWLHQEENCRLSFGISGLKDDVTGFHLHRIPMDKSLNSARSIIQREYSWYLMKSFLNKNRIRRK